MSQRSPLILVIILLALVSFAGLYTTYLASGSAAVAGDVIISEVAWSGTGASATDEWIELHNPGEVIVPLAGWRLTIGDDITITLTGTIGAKAFFLLERSFDDTVSDIPADQVYSGSMLNSGTKLTLVDDDNQIIDRANGDGGPWPAGTASPDYRSMERIRPTAVDIDSNWVSNDGITRNGLDADFQPINGTPGQPNSSWSQIDPVFDLLVNKQGPDTAAPGDRIRYSITVSNTGSTTATNHILTDTLPAGLNFQAQNSGLPFEAVSDTTLRWTLEKLQAGTEISFFLTITIGSEVSGPVTNQIEVSAAVNESNFGNNHDSSTVRVVDINQPQILIDALYYDGYELNDLDEAIRLFYGGTGSLALDGWRLSDGSSSQLDLSGIILSPEQAIWIARRARSFAIQFGFDPSYEVEDSDNLIADLDGTWPGFANGGDEALLFDPEGHLIDALVYEDGEAISSGWVGPAVAPYTIPGVFAEEGQILYRKRDQDEGTPVIDTNTAEDWAQSPGDFINGRRVLFPGWQVDRFFFTRKITESATLEVAVTPEHGYDVYTKLIDEAEESIEIESHTFRNLAIAGDLSDAARRGVTVTVLLEGGPPGGIDDQERLACQMIELAGGQCWFMIQDEDAFIFDRYRYLHAKFILVDRKKVLIGSENLSPDSLPYDDKQDGSWGRRGFFLITDAAGVVDQITQIWEMDFASDRHHDLFRWQTQDPTFGNPPPGTIPITDTGGTGYWPIHVDPLEIAGVFSFEIIQSPENSMRDHDAFLGLVNRAGHGDTLFIEQLTERVHWGATGSSPLEDPNPRLEAYIDAARRGAMVHLLLDSFFLGTGDDNEMTCHYVNTIAHSEKIDITCAQANPTGLGIHAKLLLADLGGKGYVHLGSLNGTELSHKGNREVAIQFQSDLAYQYLVSVFEHDWPNVSYLPYISSQYRGPSDHVLISEIHFDPPGQDDTEFIELVNPTPLIQDLSNFSLGDAVNRNDFEDVRRFPDGTVIPSYETLVVAAAATSFSLQYGFNPDFELWDSDPAVPDLEDDPTWGDPKALLQLGNEGDEVILRDSSEIIVDAVTYGSGMLPGFVGCSLPVDQNFVLERYPFWGDSRNCENDFREWPFPNPGSLP